MAKKDVKPLSIQSYRDFQKAIVGNKYENILTLILYTGMREGEALGLTWDCVNFDDSTITINKQLQVRPAKEGGYALDSVKSAESNRTLVVEASAMNLLKKQKIEQSKQRLKAGAMWQAWNTSEERAKAFVFTNDMGKPYSPVNVYKAYKRIAESIGIPESRVHDLRHTYATLSFALGDNAKTVQSNLGHSNSNFTLNTYVHPTEELKKESASRMDAFINDVSSKIG